MVRFNQRQLQNGMKLFCAKHVHTRFDGTGPHRPEHQQPQSNGREIELRSQKLRNGGQCDQCEAEDVAEQRCEDHSEVFSEEVVGEEGAEEGSGVGDGGGDGDVGGGEDGG